MSDLFSEFGRNRRSKQQKEQITERESKDVYGVLVRVSTDIQVQEGDSLEMQKSRAKEIVEKNDGVLYKYYVEEGVSASKNRIKDRPILQEMLNDVESGVINKVIAYKRDRLARNTQDYLAILEICAKAKADIYYSSSGEAQMMTDGVTGKILETFLASIAEMESITLSTRVSEVMASKAARGEFTGYTLPYGFTRNSETGEIVIQEGTQEIVREIEELYLSGIGTLSIAKWLNGQKIANLGVREGGAVKKEALHKARVNRWTKSAVESILFNLFYCGIVEYSTEGNKNMQKDDDKFIRAEGNHPAMRTVERQKEIYRARDKRSAQPPRLYNTTFLLTGLLYCGECGMKYASRNTTKNGKRYSYYCCSSKQNSSKNENQKPCKNKLYKKEILEAFMEESVEKYLSSMTFDGLETEIANEFSKKQNDLHIRLKNTEETIKQLEVDEQKVLRLLMDLDPEKPTYNLFKDRYENELTVIFEKSNESKRLRYELKSQLDDKQEDELITHKVLEKMENFTKVYRNSPIHLKKVYLDEIIDRIELFADGSVELYFKVQMESEGNDDNNSGNNHGNGTNSNGNVNGSSTDGYKVMNAETGEEVVINNGLLGDAIRPKIITNISFKITIPSFVALNIEEWRLEVSQTLKTKFPQWIKYIAGGDHVTAYRVHKEMNLDKGTIYKIFNCYDVPTEGRVQQFADFYGSSVDEFLEFTGLELSRNVIFDKFFQWSKMVSRN